ncbi:MAG: cytochrome P450 [Candidatus Binataceae bacterium]|nr:cytochrome P450 [Candidatus Binataceae bacterium]
MPQENLVEIPQPPEKLMLGNLLDLDRAAPVQGFMNLARKYGPIFRLKLRGNTMVVASSAALVDELCDETRFDKSIRGALGMVRKFSGDGLFTARTDEANWSKAHHILLPTFSQRAMQSYHAMMLDIAGQLAAKWERLNADDEIDVARDMTSLTLDTIGLCGFDYRFNSFYRDESHPFVGAMVDALSCAMEQVRRLPLERFIRIQRDREYAGDIDYMNQMVDRIIKERRAAGDDSASKPDLLNFMLSGVDKKSGERLDDLNIRYQIITFLIAGHETTSGLLSFTINALVNNPAVLARAYDEVDRVLGPDASPPPTYAQVNQLTYITQILKEALRLWPTAPAFSLFAREDTVIGGKYLIKREWNVLVLLPTLHRDPAVWGENPELFNPDNFIPAVERKRPPNAYKPFGNGQRACIGRQFAMQEAALVLGMLLHRFKLIDHHRYRLKIKETLTMKPDGFKIRVRPRIADERKVAAAAPAIALAQPAASTKAAAAMTPAAATAPRHATPLLVLYGSNLGTAEEIARRIADDGDRQGFAAAAAPLDDYVDRLPAAGAVVVVSASYNGTPPDNAVNFCRWVGGNGLAPNALGGVSYTVFGCGNRDWAATFQAIPRLIDAGLAAHGARRIHPRGEGDARDDFDGQFQGWYRPLWNALGESLAIDLKPDGAAAREPLYEVEVVAAARVSPLADTIAATAMRVAVNRELHTKDGPSPSPRSTRHLEIELPANVGYRAGDHLGVIPRNGDEMVRRVARRFGFTSDATVRLRKSGNRKTALPVDQPISLFALLRDYVELQAVATRSQIESLAAYTQCPPERSKLAALAGADEAAAARYRDEVLGRRVALIDLLEEAPACAMPLGVYLEMLPPLAPRYYSISSSPIADARHCSITVAIVEGEARSGHGDYRGVCSNYLLGQAAGGAVAAFVKDNHSAFRLPDDPTVPIIMIGPGTGVAPFRGFLQERSAMRAAGHPVGPAMLFFGCRDPHQDFIYGDEMRAFAAAGILQLFTAFSRIGGAPRRYVQDRLSENQDALWQLIADGAVIYVCGDASRMAPDVRRTFASIYAAKNGASPAQADAWIDQMTAAGRYLVDVWSGG